jgi:hypothetical protein
VLHLNLDLVLVMLSSCSLAFWWQVDSFVEGCCGNHPFCENNTGVGGEMCTDAGTYSFSPHRKAQIRECWMVAMEELVVFMTAGGKFPIPSTNAYISQFPDFYARQRNVLATHGGFKFGAWPRWRVSQQLWTARMRRS